MKRIETPGGWRYLADDGRISAVIVCGECGGDGRVFVHDQSNIQWARCESCKPTEWLTGAAAIVARLEWEQDHPSECYDGLDDFDVALAIARDELDRERANTDTGDTE